MTAASLLIELKRKGVEFIDDDGRLRVITPKGVTLAESLKSEIRQRKTEMLATLKEQAHGRDFFPRPTPGARPCPHCSRLATIEAIEPSLDGKRMLTFWHCEPCQTYAVTPDTIREPPVWVRRIRQ